MTQTLHWIGRTTPCGGRTGAAGSRELVRRWINAAFRRMPCSTSLPCTRRCVSSCPICAISIAGSISPSRRSMPSSPYAKSWASAIRKNCRLPSHSSRTTYATTIASHPVSISRPVVWAPFKKKKKETKMMMDVFSYQGGHKKRNVIAGAPTADTNTFIAGHGNSAHSSNNSLDNIKATSGCTPVLPNTTINRSPGAHQPVTPISTPTSQVRLNASFFLRSRLTRVDAISWELFFL